MSRLSIPALARQEPGHSEPPEPSRFVSETYKTVWISLAYFIGGGGVIRSHYFTHKMGNESGLGVCSWRPDGNRHSKGRSMLECSDCKETPYSICASSTKESVLTCNRPFLGGASEKREMQHTIIQPQPPNSNPEMAPFLMA